MNMPERPDREIRRRTRIVGIFPGPDSCLRLITTCLTEYTGGWSVSMAYIGPQRMETLLENAVWTATRSPENASFLYSISLAWRRFPVHPSSRKSVSAATKARRIVMTRTSSYGLP